MITAMLYSIWWRDLDYSNWKVKSTATIHMPSRYS